METKTSWVNPRMLRWAREQVGLSLEQVGELSQGLKKKLYSEIEPQELEQWEKGQAEPELEHLETLSELYVRPVGHFFLPEPPQEQQALSFRGLAPGKQDRLKPVSRQTLRRFLDLAEWTASVIEEAAIDWSVKIERYSRQIEIQALAQQERKWLGFNPALRAQWEHPEDAFLWWRNRIESLGVFCFQMPLDPGDIRGASIWLHNRYPFILVNHKDLEAATGRLFTLLHEYAHLLTNREGLVCDFRGAEPTSGLEPFANQFAARMLVSFEEMGKELRRIGEDHYRKNRSDAALDRIREPFFVSRDVVAITLQEMELAPPSFYKQKLEQWESRQPFGRGKGGTLSQKERMRRELGFSLSGLLVSAYERGVVSPIEMADVVGAKVEKVERILSGLEGEGALE